MQHELLMQRCFDLAEMASGNTAPNPMVGAVLIHKNKIISEGWHQKYGGAHAEVNCINNVASEHQHLIAESTMYVNLEPCAHQGKTPPCANMLVQQKIKRVVICNEDPNEKVKGRGIQILRENGIEVIEGILEQKGRWLNRKFFCFHQIQRPYIILKWAQSQEGFIAPKNKTRTQLSNKHSMQLVHRWRTEEAAILVGYNTALNDNSQLSARLWKGRQPLRIILDEHLNLPESLYVFDNSVTTWIVNSRKNAAENDLHFVKIDFGKDFLAAFMQKLFEANIISLIIEGGAKTLKSFINKGLWDEARIFHTNNSLRNGIKAPEMQDAKEMARYGIADDELHIYVRAYNTDSFVNY